VIMICLGYGTRVIARHQAYKDTKLLKIAVIQADIPQCRLPTEEQAVFALEKHLELTELAALSNPDMVVWPETAVPLPYRSSHPVSIKYRREISRISKEKGIPFLIGTIDYGDVPFEKRSPDEIPVHNSAILVGKDGDIVEKYHKVHLVPFGEYTPFGDHFSKLKKYFGMGRDLTPGRDYTIFELPNGLSAGVNICFEDIFPDISRKLTKKGAELIFVLTNDAWYPKSSEPEQHFSHSIFRAIENRRKIVRSGNNNFSSVVSQIGTVEDAITHTKDKKGESIIPYPSKKTRGYGIFQVETPLRQKTSFYTKHGDVFIMACSLLLLLSCIEILWKWKNYRQELAQAFDKKEI
nr:apolipoprotein N-acyltransferase [Victivallales bacterium]